MFPIILDTNHARFILAGSGPAAKKRLSQLRGINADVKLFENSLPTAEDIKNVHIVYAADLSPKDSKKLATMCRKLNVLVNIEDVIPLCDFHTPSIVRQGSLLFSISTGGKSPGLARALRKHLSRLFGPEWKERLDLLAEKRGVWRADGNDMKTVAGKTDTLIEEKGWLK
jgi:precorrin-2 dehydrogenase/sirohydrochlorin ferrochelatase